MLNLVCLICKTTGCAFTGSLILCVHPASPSSSRVWMSMFLWLYCSPDPQKWCSDIWTVHSLFVVSLYDYTTSRYFHNFFGIYFWWFKLLNNIPVTNCWLFFKAFIHECSILLDVSVDPFWEPFCIFGRLILKVGNIMLFCKWNKRSKIIQHNLLSTQQTIICWIVCLLLTWTWLLDQWK